MSSVEFILVAISVLLVLNFLAILALAASRTANLQEIGNSLRNLRKSNKDNKLAGVCAGLGEHTPIPGWIWRVLFLLLLFCGGVGLITYLIFAICMPAARNDIA